MYRRARIGFTLIELLVVIAIISVLMSMVLPGIQSAREAARRVQCKNNLVQVCLALHNYEMAYETLPPGVVALEGPIDNVRESSRLGWAAHLLPYCEQSSLYNMLNFSQAAYSEANWTGTSPQISALLCPSRTSNNDMSYAACHHDVEAPIDVDNHGVMYLDSRVSRDQILDGPSNTIFVGEYLGDAASFGWASGTRASLRNTGTPLNANPTTGVFRDPFDRDQKPKSATWVGGFGSNHLGGSNFALGDGTIRYVGESIDREVYRRLGNRADGGLPARW